MNDLTPILLVLLVAAVVAVVSLWRKVAKLEQFLRAEQKALEDKRDDVERAKKEARERRDELETAKKQLQEAKTKLTKRDKKEESAKSPGSKKQSAAADAEAQAPSVSAIVRITDQELEAQHRRTVERLEGELDSAKVELGRLRELEERRAREAARATEALNRATAEAAGAAQAAQAAQAAAAAAAPAPAGTPAEEVEALKTQLEAMKRAAIERQRDLERKLSKSEENANHALRRAANNQQLYQVIKGQLELAEDRLAQLRRKYEGAKSIDELRREQRSEQKRKERRERRNEPRAGNGSHPADEAGAGAVAVSGESAPAEAAAEAASTTVPPEAAPPPIEHAAADAGGEPSRESAPVPEGTPPAGEPDARS